MVPQAEAVQPEPATLQEIAVLGLELGAGVNVAV